MNIMNQPISRGACGTALLLACFLNGCQTTPPVNPVVKVDSEPQVAGIFFGSGPNEKDAEKTRSYLGTTPLEWAVPDPNNDNGKFRIDGALVYSIAVPPAAIFFAERLQAKPTFSRENRSSTAEPPSFLEIKSPLASSSI